MSRRPAPEWIVRRGCSEFGLTAVERAVLMCLWDHAGTSREAFPSAPTIALETGFKVRAVKSALMELERRKFTMRAPAPAPTRGHSRRAVTYVLEPSPRMVVRLESVVQDVH